jgi:uncharacterized protein YcbK (DUF882 family)
LQEQVVQADQTVIQHLIGRAADVVVAGIDPGLVAEVLAQYGATGLKVYKHFTHADTRSGPKWGG